jgi:hypothetical protein
MIVYQGPSLLDGSPIVAIATGFTTKSENEKTGAGMVQIWILRADMHPIDASRTGADFAICGACPRRGRADGEKAVGRDCYVTLGFAPASVYRTFKRGRYPTVAPEDLAATFAGHGVRLGAYGDPAAVPLHVWDAILSRAAYWTGYTHQWQNAPELARYVMASADSVADQLAAKMLGFRVFRVRDEAEPLLPREVTCPASKEAGKRTTCDACRACGGLGAKAKADIAIMVHGNGAKKFKAAA